MKKLLTILLIALCVSALSQTSPKFHFVIENNLTQFGINLPKGCLVYDLEETELYVLTAPAASTATLSTATAQRFPSISGTPSDNYVVLWDDDHNISQSSLIYDNGIDLTLSSITKISFNAGGPIKSLEYNGNALYPIYTEMDLGSGTYPFDEIYADIADKSNEYFVLTDDKGGYQLTKHSISTVLSTNIEDLTNGYGVSSFTYNGSSAQTVEVDTSEIVTSSHLADTAAAIRLDIPSLADYVKGNGSANKLAIWSDSDSITYDNLVGYNSSTYGLYASEFYIPGQGTNHSLHASREGSATGRLDIYGDDYESFTYTGGVGLTIYSRAWPVTNVFQVNVEDGIGEEYLVFSPDNDRAFLVDDFGIMFREGEKVDNIENTITNDDTHIATSGAIYDLVSDTAAAIRADFPTGNETITLSGDVTGLGTTAITTTVVDDSHNHIISNIDYLQDSLNQHRTDWRGDISDSLNALIIPDPDSSWTSATVDSLLSDADLLIKPTGGDVTIDGTLTTDNAVDLDGITEDVTPDRNLVQNSDGQVKYSNVSWGSWAESYVNVGTSITNRLTFYDLDIVDSWDEEKNNSTITSNADGSFTFTEDGVYRAFANLMVRPSTTTLVQIFFYWVLDDGSPDYMSHTNAYWDRDYSYYYSVVLESIFEADAGDDLNVMVFGQSTSSAGITLTVWSSNVTIYKLY